MFKKIKNEKGSLALTLIFVTVLFSLGIALSSRTIMNSRYNESIKNDKKAFHLAQAGTEQFMNKLNSEENIEIELGEKNKKNLNDLGYFWFEIKGYDEDSIEIKKIINNINDYIITSVANVKDTNVHKKISFGFGGSPPIFMNDLEGLDKTWNHNEHDVEKVNVEAQIEDAEIPKVDFNDDLVFEDDIDNLNDYSELKNEAGKIYYTNNNLKFVDEVDNENEEVSIKELNGNYNEPIIFLIDGQLQIKRDLKLEHVYFLATDIEKICVKNGGLDFENVMIYSNQSFIGFKGQLNENNRVDFTGNILRGGEGEIRFGLENGGDQELFNLKGDSKINYSKIPDSIYQHDNENTFSEFMDLSAKKDGENILKINKWEEE